VTLAAVEELSEEEGLHKYEPAPVTLSVVDCPAQMVSSGVTERTGGGLTVTVTCCDAEHPSEFPVTVYVVVVKGVAVALEPVEELSDADGLHEYVFAPEAESIALCPTQTVSLGETETAGNGFTITVM
jgi:hypothetical protein